MDVLIIGGGLCGLATSISIALSGHQVTVLEASDDLHEFGAGLQSSPNGTRLFQRWGIADVLQPVAAAPETLEIRNFDGTVLARRQKYDNEIKQRYGHPLWALHRIDLQQALLHRAEALGVHIKFASRVVHLDVARTKPLLRLETGEEHQGDLVVVADGVWSSLNSRVLGRPVAPEPTGDMAYRIMLEASQVSDDEELSEFLRTPRVQQWLGPRAHAVGYSVRNSSQLNVVLAVKDDFEASAKAREAKRPGDVEEMRRLFEGWDPLLTKILQRVESVAKWRLMNLNPLPSWRSAQGSCVLAGDCCHAILPYMAQGLNMGLEDAAILGCLLGHVQSAEQLPRATAMYESIRIARASRILDETRVHAKYWHSESPEAQEKRKVDMARSFEENTTWTHPRQQRWIWSYDAYKEAEEAYSADPF